MKKLFTILILLFTFKFYSQSYYKKLFDSKGYDTSIGYSKDKDRLEFSWGVPAQMEALVIMYEKTGEKKYAETLIKFMTNVIDRRDDLIGNISGLRKVSDYRGISGAAWSTNHYNITPDKGLPYAHLVHSANILYPMAKFAAIVKRSTSIQSLVSNSKGRYGRQTYGRIADDIIRKVNETLNYHKDQWCSGPNGMGYYKERSKDRSPIAYPDEILPLNMQSSIGRVFVQMYIATLQKNYLEKVYEISNFIKSNTFLNNNLQSYTWKYWKKTDLADDISHAGLTISFPYECYKYKIVYEGKLVYSNLEIQRYINTFMKDIYKYPLFLNGGVNNNTQYWDLKSNIRVGDLTNDSYICNRWLYLSEYDKALYKTIVDIQNAKNYYTKIDVNDSLTIALLAYNES